MVVEGQELGVLVGPGGATLAALQELARTFVQKRTGGQSSRIIVDVAGYRAKRTAALQRFAQQIAEEVIASGSDRALEPMSAADRKVVHDTINEIDGLSTRSEGEEPRRYIVISARQGAADDGPRAPDDLGPGIPEDPRPRRSARSSGPDHDRRREPSLPARVLEEARALDLLGPMALDEQVDHALGFARAFEQATAQGAGTEYRPTGPGIGWTWDPEGVSPGSCWPSTGRSPQRFSWMPPSVARRSWPKRCTSWAGTSGSGWSGPGPRKPAATPSCEGRSTSVWARSFGSPPVTAECAAPFLKLGGLLVVSEPPCPGRGWNGARGGPRDRPVASGRAGRAGPGAPA